MRYNQGWLFFNFFSTNTTSLWAAFGFHFLEKEKSTSIHVGGQGHKLVELVFGEEGADVIGWLSLWAHIEVTNDEGGFLEVDELLQKMFGPEQRFIL